MNKPTSPLFWPLVISLLFSFTLLWLYINQQNKISSLQQQITSLDAGKNTNLIPSVTPELSPSLSLTSTPLIAKKPPTATPAPKLIKAVIQDTSSWIEQSCSNVSFKIPKDMTSKCIENQDGSTDVLIAKAGAYGTNNIMIRNYDGGSRRQWWMDQMRSNGTTEKEFQQYVRFEDTLYGKVNGLAVYADGGWWQGGYASPILIANGKTLVYLYGGNDFNSQTGKINRDPWVATLASTIKFL